MEKVYLQWNVTNWVTVVLMASVGMLAVGAVMAGISAYRNNGSSAE